MAKSDLKIAHLRAFAAVAAAGSFSGAARRARCSQPALSRKVQVLEAQLGVRLLDRARSVRRVALTEAGRTLLPHALALLDRHDRMLAALAPPSRPNGRSRPFRAGP